MKFGECSRESELQDAVKIGHWPIGCDSALREHVEHCESCGETVLLAQLLREDRAGAVQQVPFASAGLLWWRAQILQRQAAIRRASRPLHFAIAVSLITSVLVVVGVLLNLRSQIASWLLTAVALPVSAQTNSVSSLTISPMPQLLGLCALAALAGIGGIVVYAAFQRE